MENDYVVSAVPQGCSAIELPTQQLHLLPPPREQQRMIASLLSDITNRLALISSSPVLDASVLIGRVLGKPRTWVMAHPELSLTTEQYDCLNASLERLERGEPLPYVLGHWEFFGLDLEVTPDVLIPRPETELLVEKAIGWLEASRDRRTITDVGTGSGAMAIALAMHIPDAHILATDISLPALEVAKRNVNKFDLGSHIDLVNCDLLPPFPHPAFGTPLPILGEGTGVRGHFDLICANLPYIPTKTLQGLKVFDREPALALDGGEDGLCLFRRLLNIAPQWLAPRGMILLEVESTLGSQALSLAYDSFSEAFIQLTQDLSGRDRLLEIIANN